MLKKFSTTAMLVASLIAGSMVASAPARANDAGAFVAGAIVGGVTSAIIINEANKRHYGKKVYAKCRIRTVKVWSNYYDRWVWKKQRVCRY